MALYVRALLYEFRFTVIALFLLLITGTFLYMQAPGEFSDNSNPLVNSAYAAWMVLLNQPVHNPPTAWYLVPVCMIYPVIGVGLIGEGVVRLALLMFSRRHGLKEWMRVMASTYRDHIVVCGVGKLGTRVTEQLVSAGLQVVAIEKSDAARFLPQLRTLGVPVIVGDMKDDAILISAGIPKAAVVIIATNDDMANLEVALDARRMNPQIRVVMRLFEQSIAQKISDAFLVDVAFSASHLAAPIVAAMSMGGKVLTSTLIAGIPHVTAELKVEEHSALAARTIAEIEAAHACKVLARTSLGREVQLPPAAADQVAPGDVLVVHAASAHLMTLAGAARAAIGKANEPMNA